MPRQPTCPQTHCPAKLSKTWGSPRHQHDEGQAHKVAAGFVHSDRLSKPRRSQDGADRSGLGVQAHTHTTHMSTQLTSHSTHNTHNIHIHTTPNTQAHVCNTYHTTHVTIPTAYLYTQPLTQYTHSTTDALVCNTQSTATSAHTPFPCIPAGRCRAWRPSPRATGTDSTGCSS